MQNPTLRQFNTVLDNIELVLPMAEHETALCMADPVIRSVDYQNTCRTFACFGGWYAVAKNLSKFEKIKGRSYTIGVDLLNQDLFGQNAFTIAFRKRFPFSSDSTGILTTWAKRNPALWGNSSGALIFIDALAFQSQKRPEGANSLRDIYDHLTEVRDRCHPVKNNEVG